MQSLEADFVHNFSVLQNYKRSLTFLKLNIGLHKHAHDHIIKRKLFTISYSWELRYISETDSNNQPG